MKINPNEPLNCNNGKGFWTDEFSITHAGRGLTKREYFAVQIASGLATKLSSDGNPNQDLENALSSDAVRLADALIAELNKPKTDE